MGGVQASRSPCRPARTAAPPCGLVRLLAQVVTQRLVLKQGLHRRGLPSGHADGRLVGGNHVHVRVAESAQERRQQAQEQAQVLRLVFRVLQRRGSRLQAAAEGEGGRGAGGRGICAEGCAALGYNTGRLLCPASQPRPSAANRHAARQLPHSVAPQHSPLSATLPLTHS